MIRLIFLWCVGLMCFACAKKPVATTEVTTKPEVVQPVQDSVKNNPLSTIFLIEGVQAKHMGEQEKAISMFAQAVSVDENNDAAHFELANMYLTNEFYDAEAALENLQTAYTIKPDNELYELTYGRALIDAKQFEKGLPLFEALAERHPTKINYSYDLAYAYEQAGQISKALSVYDEIEEKYGFNPEINYQRHVLYFDQGEKEKGIEEIKEIVDQYPQYTSYSVFLADYYLQTDRFDLANHYAQLALEQESGNARAFAIQLQSLAKQNKSDDFNQSLDKLIHSEIEFDTKVQLLYPLISVQEEKPDWKNSIHNALRDFAENNNDRAEAYALYADVLYNGGKPEEAEPIYKKSLTIQDDVYSVWEQLINFYIYKTDYQKLGPFAELASQKFPEKSFPAYISGLAYYRTSNAKKATEVLEAATSRELETEEFDIEILTLLADAYHENKEYEKAYVNYDKVLLKEPDNAHVLNNYSYFLADRKHNLDKAEKMAARALELNPQDANTLDTYGWVMFQKEDYTKAEELLAKAAEQVPNSATILEHYGDALFKNGKIDQAVTQWQKAFELNSNNATLGQKIALRQFVE